MSHNKKPKETIYYHYVLVALPNFISAEFGNKLVKGAGIDIACLAYNHKDNLLSWEMRLPIMVKRYRLKEYLRPILVIV